MNQTMSRLAYHLGLLGILLTGMAPLAAQTLYRCGNTYQDKPCTNGQQGKVVNILKGGDSKDGLLDVKCSQRGQEAQKLMWAREAGASEKDMREKAKDEAERELVTSVYRQRGTSTQVRQAVEAACIAEKDKAGTALPPPVKREGSGPGSDGRPAGAASAAASAAGVASAGANSKANCDKMRSEMGALLGKDVSKEQREAVAAALKSAGC